MFYGDIYIYFNTDFNFLFKLVCLFKSIFHKYLKGINSMPGFVCSIFPDFLRFDDTIKNDKTYQTETKEIRLKLKDTKPRSVSISFGFS